MPRVRLCGRRIAPLAIHRQLTLCRRLRALREARELTQSAVADALKMSQASYCRLERGEIELSLSRLMALSELYGVELAVLCKDI